MNEKMVLSLLSLFEALYKKLGVDYDKMVEILKIKLLMDRRRMNTALQRDEENTKDRNYFMWNIIILGFVGLMMGFMLWLPLPLFLSMNFFFSMLIVMLMSMFISDYSTVLLDLKEKSIFFSRPLEEKTVNAAKITHIILYVSSYGLTLSLPGLAIGSLRHGVVFAAMGLIATMLIVAFTVFLSGGLYFILLKTFSGERLKDILNYFQIVVSIFIVIAYQVVPRMFTIRGIEISFTESFWMYFMPSAWFSAPFSIIFDDHLSSFMVMLSIIGIFLPIVLTVIYLKKITPYFEANLQKLEASDNQRQRISKLWQSIIHVIGKNSQEKAFMEFILINLQRDRNLKLRILPQLAFAVIFPLILMGNVMLGDPQNMLQNLREVKSYMFMYGSTLILCGMYSFLTLTDYPKAAQIYEVLPVKNEVDAYYAAFKICIVKYILPITLSFGILFMIIYRGEAYPQILTVISNTLFTFLWVSSISKGRLPMSTSFTNVRDDNLRRVVITLPFAGVLIGIHFAVNSYGTSPVIVLVFALLCLMTSWKIFIPMVIQKNEVK